MQLILLATTILLSSLAVSALPDGTPAPPGPNPPPVVPSSEDSEQIRYTLSLYPMAVDSKDYGAFGEIFVDDVHVNYGAPLGNLTGVPALASSLQTILANVTTLHLFSAPNILMFENHTALVVTKAQASHFGQGDYAGQEYLLYGQYRDIFRRVGHTWKIAERISYAVASFGNVTIFGAQSAHVHK